MASQSQDLSWDQFSSVEVKALNVSSREKISIMLDKRLTTFSESGRVQDWRGLAELIGLGASQIQVIEERPSGGYTNDLIKRMANREFTIGKFIEYLRDLERHDIIEDEELLQSVCADVSRYTKNKAMEFEEKIKREAMNDQPYNEDENAGESPEERLPRFVLSDEPGKPTYFDAFVSYAHEDLDFVKQMIVNLEENQGFKLCLPGRDLLPGTAMYSAIGELIEHRCKKVIALISSHYLQSPECDFQTKFTQSLSPGFQNKKLVPVLIRPLRNEKIPNVLRCITLVDYTKCQVVDWFWKRLEGCLRDPLPAQENETSRRLSNNDVLTITRQLSRR